MDLKKLSHEVLLELYDEYEDKYRSLLERGGKAIREVSVLWDAITKEIQVRQNKIA